MTLCCQLHFLFLHFQCVSDLQHKHTERIVWWQLLIMDATRRYQDDCDSDSDLLSFVKDNWHRLRGGCLLFNSGQMEHEIFTEPKSVLTRLAQFHA